MKLFLLLLAVIGGGFAYIHKKYAGPGDDILVPEGSSPSWSRAGGGEWQTHRQQGQGGSMPATGGAARGGGGGGGGAD